MARLKTIIAPIMTFIGACVLCTDVHAETANGLSSDLRQRVDAAITEGLGWLAQQQADDGSWSNPRFPALSALPLEAFLGGSHAENAAIIKKACDFLLSNAQDDGGIYVPALIPGRGGLSTYNTAVCMTALHASGRPDYLPVILRARRFVADSQLSGDDEHAGGFGYGKSRFRRSTDLMVTMHALEAMYRTRAAEDSRPSGSAQATLNEETVSYISSMQNREDSGSDNAGGFYYGPGKSGAGKSVNAEGEVIFRSYGSMTYAGLLALIYADVSRKDPRVVSAFGWAKAHWSLDENPGLGDQGMYFFYYVLAKALAAYGQDRFETAGGQAVEWKTALAEKLLELRTPDPETGMHYWVNENGRYWENNPVLVTSYALLALQNL